MAGSWEGEDRRPGTLSPEVPLYGTPPQVPLYGTPPERPHYGRPGHGLGPEVPLPEAHPVDEPVTQPVTERVSEPVTEPVSEPVTEPLTAPVTEPRSDPFQPGHGGLALVLGLIGVFVFPPIAPAALIIGWNEVRGVDAGRRHPRGRGLGQAGLVLGVVGTVLLALWMLMGAFVLLLVASAARSLFGG